MLDTLYVSFFRPADLRQSAQATVIIGGLVILVLALNAAGALGLGVKGVIGFTLLFLLAGVLGWFWLAAAVQLLATLFGGQGTSQDSLAAIARGLWPLLLSGPAIAAAQWSPSLGALLSLALNLGTFFCLAIAIQDAHQLNWFLAAFCLALTLGLSLCTLLGVFLWPVMIVLGT